MGEPCDFVTQVLPNLNVWPLALVTLLFHFHRDIALDIADVRGDKAGSLTTIPILLGTRMAYAAVYLLLMTTLVVAFLILFSVWHAEWPGKSRMAFCWSRI